MKRITETITVIAARLDSGKVYISGFSSSQNTYNITGKLLIPHFTTDPKKAQDCVCVEHANDLILLIIDYNGRFYKPVSLSV